MSKLNKIRLRKPISIKFTQVDANWWLAEHTKTGTLGHGTTPSAAIKRFMEDLLVGCDGLIGVPDSELSKDAQDARDALTKLMRTVVVIE